MGKGEVREPTPQEAQRNGQSGISQDEPLRELHQGGAAQSGRPTSPAVDKSELVAGEVFVSR
jgi:hypothetical protein